jgi:hypothetical protein
MLLEHEQRIVGRQGGDEGDVDREIVASRVAGAAGPPVTAEGLLEEDRGSRADLLGGQAGLDARILLAGGLAVFGAERARARRG